MSVQDPSEHGISEIAQNEAEAADARRRRREALAEIDGIISNDAPVFVRMVGVPGLTIRLEQSSEDGDDPSEQVPGMRWLPETKELSLDPDDLLGRGYAGEEIVYAILVEALVNVREPLVEPDLGADVKRFTGAGEAEAIFYGVFSSLAASRRAHAMLPRWEAVGAQLYGQRLYPEDRFTADLPRHLQFLYKVVREQMVPGSVTAVAPEVDGLLEELHDYLGTGQDLLAYSTQHAKSPTEVMTARERFSVWTRNVYPRWVELIEIDRSDPTLGAPRRNRATGPRTARRNRQPETDFSDFYERHRAQRQPRRTQRSEQETLRKAVTSSRRLQSDPGLRMEAQLRAETGHGNGEYRRYALEVERFREQVDQIRSIYRDLLHNHVGRRRRLRGGHTEGAMLSPERLAQTALEIRLGTLDPPAFSDYEHQLLQRDRSGRADYVFVFDRSGSMLGEKSAAAASAAVICLEAFAGMQRDIEEIETASGVDLDLDIRCAVYTFNDIVSIPKPLSKSISLKERLDTLSEVRSPSGGNADTHVLQAILDYPPSPDRTRTLIVVSDGEADDPELARSKVERLRGLGWRVYGISIGSEAAVRLYAPHSRRVDDPALVPEAMRRLVEENL